LRRIAASVATPLVKRRPDCSDPLPKRSAEAAGRCALVAVAVATAWAPVETHPLNAVVIAAVVLFSSPWGWRRSGPGTVAALEIAAAALAALCCSAASGFDPSRGVGALALAAAVVALAWLASRSQPTAGEVTVFALGLAALALWGVWQVAGGLDGAAGALQQVPEPARAYARERLASGRAYASLPLPSHLAVLLATALPLLLRRVRADRLGIIAGIGAATAVVGLALSRSPVGILLALAAALMVLVGGRRRPAIIAIVLLAGSLAAVVAARPDLSRLEPVALRMDNWRTAVWLWQTSPADGAGVSSFAQATQGSPLVVGNRPAHAHSLPFEALAELGPAGLAAVALLAIGMIRLVIVLWPRNRALAAAVVVVPVHNTVDFSLFVSGVAIPWAVLLGWGIATASKELHPARRARGRVALVAAAAAALAMCVLHFTGTTVEQAAASRAGAVDRYDGALASLRLAPWRVQPQFLLAAAAMDSGNPMLLDQAWQELDRRRWWRPRSAALAERRFRLAIARRDLSAAVSELWSAVELGPPDEGRAAELSRMLFRLDGVVDDQTD
jgi:hypothetical protein